MLKLQYFGHLMRRGDSLEKSLMLGKIEGKRRRGQQRMRWLGGITGSMDMNVSKLWVMVKDRVTWHAAVRAVTKSRTQLSDGTTPTKSCGVQSLSRFGVCDPTDCSTPASLSITNSQSLFKLMSIESMDIQSSHSLPSPPPPAFNLSQHQGLFQ